MVSSGVWGDDERFHPRLGSGRVLRARWSKDRGHRGWVDSVPRRPIGHRQNDGLTRDDTGRRGATRRPGVALEQARRTKEATYPELEGDEGRARLVVLAAETRGRWSGETAEFLRCLAKAKAETAPVLMQQGESCLIEEGLRTREASEPQHRCEHPF